MADVTGILQRRVFGVPLWLAGLVLIGGSYAVYRLGLFGGRQAPAPAPAPSAVAPDQGLLQQLQGQQGQQVQGANPQFQRPPQPVWQFGSPQGSFVWHTTGVNAPAGVPGGQVYPGSAGTPATNPQAFPGFGAYSWQWTPLPQGSDPTGSPWTDTSYAAALASAGIGGAGTGGRVRMPARLRQRAEVGTTSGLWRSGHPVIRSGDVLHAHYALGGPGSVHAAAAHVGVHPARLLALNPHLRAGRAQGAQYIRIR